MKVTKVIELDLVEIEGIKDRMANKRRYKLELTNDDGESVCLTFELYIYMNEWMLEGNSFSRYSLAELHIITNLIKSLNLQLQKDKRIKEKKK
jgi:hypothetical protein